MRQCGNAWSRGGPFEYFSLLEPPINCTEIRRKLTNIASAADGKRGVAGSGSGGPDGHQGGADLAVPRNCETHGSDGKGRVPGLPGGLVGADSAPSGGLRSKDISSGTSSIDRNLRRHVASA